MLELYHTSGSVCSQKVRLALAEKGLDWADRHIELSKDEHLRAEYLALNPNGVVPTLVHGGRVVIGSFAGAVNDPAWVLNLRDRDANPGVKVRTQHGRYWSEHQILEGVERDDLWALMTVDRAFYADYQAKTERSIPMIRLPESEALEA